MGVLMAFLGCWGSVGILMMFLGFQESGGCIDDISRVVRVGWGLL